MESIDNNNNSIKRKKSNHEPAKIAQFTHLLNAALNDIQNEDSLINTISQAHNIFEEE